MSTINTILLINGHNSGTRVVHTYFPYNKEPIDIFKSQTLARWSNKQRCRKIYEEDFAFSIINILEGKYSVDIFKLKIITSFLMPKVYIEKLQQKQYRKNTFKIYYSYFKKYKPYIYLFEGQKKQLQYSGKSITYENKHPTQKTGIKKKVYPHILRHSFATHHIEQGTDKHCIQKLIDHDSINIYPRCSN